MEKSTKNLSRLCTVETISGTKAPSLLRLTSPVRLCRRKQELMGLEVTNATTYGLTDPPHSDDMAGIVRF